MRSLLIATVLFTSLPAFAARHAYRPAGKNLPAVNILWRNPGAISRLNLYYGSGERFFEPAAPFRFIREDMRGSNPKILVRDARGREWSVKWSEEAQPEVFCSRLAWACGYISEVEYFVPRGRVLGAGRLERAGRNVNAAGYFTDARFQLRTKWPRFLTHNSWSWNYNPFVGTRELNGLRILMMLVSNWDNKDARDIDRDSNVAIFEDRGRPPEYLYFVADWGASLGRWGHVWDRSKWDCRGFEKQTPHFVQKVRDGVVHFGYVGQHTEDARHDISTEDVEWLLRYLGQIRDAQYLQALRAAGADRAECDCYLSALRERVDELRDAVRPMEARR